MMPNDLEKEDKFAKVFVDTVQKLAEGKSSDGLAKLLVGTIVVLSGSPWWFVVEPVLSKALAQLNNQAGKDAAAAIAVEVEDDEKRRRLAAEVSERLAQILAELFACVREQENASTREVVDAVQSSAADLLVRFGLQLHRLEERLVPELGPPVSLWRSLSPGTRALARGAVPKPSDLLVAAHQAVRFVGREKTLEALTSWVAGPQPVALAVVTGRGGSGKTRLAMEVSAQLRANGIPAGFLIGSSDAPVDEALSGSGMRVVIIDYAEGKPELLKRVLQRLAHGTGLSVRILFLARERGEWWDDLATIPETDDRLLSAAQCLPLDGEGGALSPHERQHAWSEAVAAFRKNVRCIASPAPPDYSADVFGRPLTLLMHALVSLDEPAPNAEPELLRRVLVHEERHHNSMIDALDLSRPERVAILRVVRELAAIGTLLGGVNTNTALRQFATDRLARLLGRTTDALVDQVLNVAVALYPLGKNAIAPLEPDLLGEALMAAITQTTSDVLEQTVILASSREQRMHVLTVLARHASRTKDESRLCWLFRAHLDFAFEAIDVARGGGQEGHAITTALEAELNGRGRSAADLCLEISERCPHTSIALTDVALTATSIALSAAREKADEHKSEDRAAEVARLAHNLATMLCASNRRAEALAAAQEATDINRRLAQINSDAFLPCLAASVSNLAVMLRRVARNDDALAAGQEATALYRELSGADPDKFLPHLAGCLSNLAGTMSNVGQHDRALHAAREATRLRRDLVKGDPVAHLPDLAMSLNDMAAVLCAVGQYGEALTTAQDASRIFRELADKQSDAFLPDLGMSLLNLATRLSDVGQHDAAVATAEDATVLYRRLARVRSSVYGTDFAAALLNLANRLVDAERREEALVAARNALAFYHEFSTARPDAFLPNLGGALLDLAAGLSTLGEHKMALQSAQASVDVNRRLVNVRRDAFLPHLADSLNVVAELLAEMGEYSSALAAAREVTNLYAELAALHGSRFDAELATALNNLANRLDEMNEHSSAVAAGLEVADLRGSLPGDDGT